MLACRALLRRVPSQRTGTRTYTKSSQNRRPRSGGASILPSKSSSTILSPARLYNWSNSRIVSHRNISTLSSTSTLATSASTSTRPYLIFAAIGAAAALWSWQNARADTSPSGEVSLSMPADPWLLTGQVKEAKPPAPSFWQRFWRFLLSVVRVCSGYTLMRLMIRFLTRLSYEAWQYGTDTLRTIVSLERPFITLCRPIQSYELALRLVNWTSQLSGTPLSYLGSVELLDERTIASLPKERLIGIQEKRYRHWSDPDWTIPVFSSTTPEDYLLSAQYMSFLVKSHRDNGIYRIEGYFSALPDLSPIPLIMHYDKVAESLEDLQNARLCRPWISRLNSWRRVGEQSTATRDLTSVFRALCMPSDLSRLLDEEDWKAFIGAEHGDAAVEREKSKTPAYDKWRLVGPSGEVQVRIHNAPQSSISNFTVILPETGGALEETTEIEKTTIMCARWCTYLEKHPALAGMLGSHLAVTSSPTVQEFSLVGEDFDAKGLEVCFGCSGELSTAQVHVILAHDQGQDGRFPVEPVLRIWAVTEQGRLDIYSNSRSRYHDLESTPLSIVHRTTRAADPLLASNIQIRSREPTPDRS